ncbi:MAG: hypothetical protein ACQEWG_10585 [Bacteroidota bacterium]
MMELNRYENVKGVIRIIDLKIFNILKTKNMNTKELSSLVEIRNIYLEEYEGLVKSIEISETFNRKNGYER